MLGATLSAGSMLNTSLPIMMRHCCHFHIQSYNIKNIFQAASQMSLDSASAAHKHLSPFLNRSAIHTYTHLCSSTSGQRKTLPSKHEENVDNLGTWGDRIDFPLLLQPSIEEGRPIPQISPDQIGCSSVIGRRTYMEDRCVVKELKENLLYFAVFDGHGGADCANYCQDHMQKHILYWLARGETDLQSVLNTVFLEVNNAFARWITFNKKLSADSGSSGTTATVCLLRDSHDLTISHVGDSRAILCRNGDARKLTMDHCPSLRAERDRVVQSGGEISSDSLGRYMVNGKLAMTRSIGDLELKPYGVIAIPDIQQRQVQHGKDSFLVLTSDGINFAMNDQEICDVIKRCEDPFEAAHVLTDLALHYSCEDNATAVIVPFGSWGKYGSKQAMFYAFGRSMSASSRFS